jgi:HlyD family secretion protein
MIASRFKILAAVLALAVVVTLLAWFATKRRPADDFTAYGNVDIRAVTLAFRVGGRVTRVAVDEGDAVQPGEPLALLDPEPLELAAREARGAADAAEARVALLHAGYRSEDIAQAEATLAERRAAALQADQQLARQQELRGTGAVASRAYDEAVAARDQAHARLDAAAASLAAARGGFRRQEVAEAEANAARAAAARDQALEHLRDATLRAPSDGIVTTRSVEAGAIVAAGTPALTLTLPTPTWVRIYVAEPDLGRAAPGTAVLVYTDTRPAKPYHGRIGFLSPTAEFTPKNVETEDLRTALVYRARVVVSDADGGLRQGMPVTVRLDTAGSSRP